MDIFNRMVALGPGSAEMTVIKTIDMHTSGEATRIVLPGQIHLEGKTLLDQRAYAKQHADHFRRRLMREPRGHPEMYGAIIVQETERTASGEADIGVLFCHNEGYSTMCGHATIALGRFLVDTHDLSVFPRRKELVHKTERRETLVRLHAPCGVVEVCVPTIGEGENARSDVSRAVSFRSVPSFASAINVQVDIPEEKTWKRLSETGRRRVTVDIAFGGAYYAIVSTAELGFSGGIRAYDLAELDDATAKLKALLAPRRELFAHPSEKDLEYLYGVIVVEELGDKRELGLCFFANQQVDRSPTGSGVCARVALGVAKEELEVGERVEYESVVSLDAPGNEFVGQASERVKVYDYDCVVVRVSGRGYYTGAHSFLFETDLDGLRDGFEVRGKH